MISSDRRAREEGKKEEERMERVKRREMKISVARKEQGITYLGRETEALTGNWKEAEVPRAHLLETTR